MREDREHGGMLIETLEAYVAADLNVKAAAEALLRPRQHRAPPARRASRRRPGRDLRHVMDMIDLLIAIRLP